MAESFENDAIMKLVQLQKRRKECPKRLYHYTTLDLLERIFHKDELLFKMTDINCFDDKFEGKKGEEYLEEALIKLKRDGIIDGATANSLVHTKSVWKAFIFNSVDEDEKDLCNLQEYNTYVLCFSSKESDKYMIENYIKNETHKGVGICLNSKLVLKENESIQNKGYLLSILPVYYGQEAVNFMYNFIADAVKICGDNSELFNKVAVHIIHAKADELCYTSKLSDFAIESETRLILHVANNCPRNYCNLKFAQSENGILIPINRRSYNMINFFNCSDDEIDENKRILEGMYYRV